jgi:parallel beta-helix repeat protein
MKHGTRLRLSRYGTAAALLLASGAVVLTTAAPANAVACSTPVRYASSSNTVYLLTNQSFTPTDIKSFCAAAPLTLVDPASQVWELSADLVLQNGARLVLHGPALGGDTGALRLRSMSSNRSTDVVQIMAMYGTIDIDGTHVQSWDDTTGAPDGDPSLPAGAGSTDRGRAFIRALSYVDSDGVTPRESRMLINNSELDHLGYYAAESYGVAYKTRGCDHTNLPVCAKAGVYGSETGSHFHDNFMGTYTWGAKGLVFTNNEYDHNVMYGLDPHDVSINLTIDHNHFDYNGDHGVICSQLCDSLTITNNESDHNGMVPFMGPTGDSDTPGQVHGIMIHRGVTNTVISGNYVHDQPNGAGIAIFDSAGDTVTNNTVVNNQYGVRISVGSAGNHVTTNTITNSSQYGLFLYKGSDPPNYTTMSGHPTGNQFDSNTIDGTGSNAVKFTEADGNTISNTTFRNTGGSLMFNLSAGNVLSNLSLPSGQRVSVAGSSAEPGSVTVSGAAAPFVLSVDSDSSAEVTSPAGQLVTVDGNAVAATVAPSGSDTHLTSAVTGTTGGVTVAPQPIGVLPAAGTASALRTGPAAVRLTGAAGTAVTFTIGGLAPGGTYTVSRNGAALTQVTADGSGTVRFTDTPPTGGPNDYAVTG